MMIKKYQASTETEAIMLAREELGNDAIVMNIKTFKPKGLFRMFRKVVVEVTAAVDENKRSIKPEADSAASYSAKPYQEFVKNIHTYREDVSSSVPGKQEYLDVSYGPPRGTMKTMEEAQKSSAIEEKINSLTTLIEKQMTAAMDEMKKPSESKPEPQPQVTIMKLIYNQLLNNEVAEPFVSQLLSDVEKNGGDSITMENILPMVYQKIILKLGRIEPISLTGNGPKVVCFIGPTGVGKTTTIAKVASKFKLEMKRRVALITADTYRIAAVDQLRTYANILSIPVEVVYKTDEIKETIDKHADCDVILMDTAGRSHKNTEQCMDLKEMVNAIASSGYECEVFLLVSATTKYKDLMKITETYADIASYKIIFTKLDETSCLGNILNIRMLTKVPLSYMTCGQNVPDDISDLDVQMVAKQLLGGSE